MERQRQQSPMSIKKKINELETAIEHLKNNDLDFEAQVDLYQDTMKKLNELTKKITELNHSIEKTEATPHDL